MLAILAWLVIAPPFLALTVFSSEVLAGLRKLPSRRTYTRNHAAAVIVPAHDEADTIAETVRHLLSAVPSGARLLVVADNCQDATAKLAQAAGAEAIERSEPLKRGKGFALAFGRAHLAANPPEVVVVVDADCAIDQQSLANLIQSAFSLSTPVQALDLLSAPQNSSALVQVSNFAMLMKNKVRARGLNRLGGGIPLFGTGMAFPWAIFASMPLGTPSIVEDLELAIELARRKVAVQLIEDATVISPSARQEDLIGQRRRWELGFVRTAVEHALPLLWQGLRQGSRHQIALALHLCVPPLALLFFIAITASIAAALFAILTSSWMPLLMINLALANAFAFTLLAWLKEGRDVLTGQALLRAPVYIFKKLPIYVGLLSSGSSSWNRTPRDPR